MISLKSALSGCDSLEKLSKFLGDGKTINVEIGTFGGRHFRTRHHSGIVCLNEIVKVFERIIKQKNGNFDDKELASAKSIEKTINALDRKGNKRLRGVCCCITRSLTSLSQYLGNYKYNRGEVLSTIQRTINVAQLFLENQRIRKIDQDLLEYNMKIPLAELLDGYFVDHHNLQMSHVSGLLDMEQTRAQESRISNHLKVIIAKIGSLAVNSDELKAAFIFIIEKRSSKESWLLSIIDNSQLSNTQKKELTTTYRELQSSYYQTEIQKKVAENQKIEAEIKRLTSENQKIDDLGAESLKSETLKKEVQAEKQNLDAVTQNLDAAINGLVEKVSKLKDSEPNVKELVQAQEAARELMEKVAQLKENVANEKDIQQAEEAKLKKLEQEAASFMELPLNELVQQYMVILFMPDKAKEISREAVYFALGKKIAPIPADFEKSEEFMAALHCILTQNIEIKTELQKQLNELIEKQGQPALAARKEEILKKCQELSDSFHKEKEEYAALSLYKLLKRYVNISPLEAENETIKKLLNKPLTKEKMRRLLGVVHQRIKAENFVNTTEYQKTRAECIDDPNPIILKTFYDSLKEIGVSINELRKQAIKKWEEKHPIESMIQQLDQCVVLCPEADNKAAIELSNKPENKREKEETMRATGISPSLFEQQFPAIRDELKKDIAEQIKKLILIPTPNKERFYEIAKLIASKAHLRVTLGDILRLAGINVLGEIDLNGIPNLETIKIGQSNGVSVKKQPKKSNKTKKIKRK